MLSVCALSGSCRKPDTAVTLIRLLAAGSLADPPPAVHARLRTFASISLLLRVVQRCTPPKPLPSYTGVA